MKVYISRIPQEGSRFSYDYDANVLDLNSKDIEFKTPLHAEIYCYKISNTVSVEIDLEGDYNLRCSRCLEIVQGHLKKSLKFSYIVNPQDAFIDTSKDAREEIMLGYPLKPLCKDECKGLCPRCGKNLNEGKCECK